MRILQVSILSSVAWLGAAAASPDDTLASAQQALNDGFPTLAIYRLEQAGTKSADDDLGKATQRLLVKAYNRAGRYGDTVALLKSHPEIDELALAQAYAGLGQNEKALELFRQIASSRQTDGLFVLEYVGLLEKIGQPSEAERILTEFLKQNPSAASDIKLQFASLLLAQGEAPRAWEIVSNLRNLSPAEAFARDYLATRILLSLGRSADAGAYLDKLQNPPPALAGNVLLSRLEYLRKTNDLTGAEKAAETFIEDNPRLAGLDVIFAQLDEIYGEQGASSGAELKRWAQDSGETQRQALALYYLARNEARSSKMDRSQEVFQEFLQKFPQHILVSEARFGLASSFLATNEPARALEALQGTPENGKTGFVKATALAELKKFPEAAASFLLSADTPALKKSALFNAAICNTLAGVPEEDNVAFREIAAMDGTDAEVQKLRLAQALFWAENRNPDAGKLLNALARGDDKIARRARLALAEWDYSRDDISSARGQLNEFRKISTADSSEKERADYLAVFLADTGVDESDKQTSQLAEAFLKEYPDSSFEPDVRMKLGEILFRKGDYLGARIQFESILEDSASSPLADKAAFLSAQAMSRSMDPKAMEDAIETYDGVVKGGGPLAVRARLAQATLFNSLNRSQDALGVLERLLESQPDPETRAMALVEKGNTLFALGPQSLDNYKQAIAVWQALASDPAASLAWRNQALTRMGQAYEKLGDTGAALNCYYKVFSGAQETEPEYFWFYKAGFDAGRLLESQDLWNEAIAVYEKIGALDGPRAEEARSRVNKLRLENFLWEK